VVQVKIWGHDYGNVKVMEAYGDRFKGTTEPFGGPLGCAPNADL
jgi:hypothetical protein